MKLHITYVTVDSVSEGVGSSQILPLLCRLSKKGIKIHLISFEKVPTKPDVQQTLTNNGIDWTRLEFGHKGALAGIYRLFRLKRAIHETDLIHARSDVPTLAAIFSRKAPVLWDIRSLWASQRAFIEKNFIKKLIFRGVKPIERFCCIHSNGISSLTHAVVAVLETQYNNVPKIRVVVPTAVDLEKFEFNPKLPQLARGLYSGTYNNYYDLEKSQEYILAIRELQDLEVHWARPSESGIEKLNAGESHIFEATYSLMPQIISEYSFGISICRQDAGPSLKAAMPTKIAEFLASGRPVVVSKGIGDMDCFLNEFKAGVILDTENDSLLDKARELLDLLNDPETPKQCRALAEKYFDIESGVSTYIKTYDQILNH
jgi:glycosyltransferase involved in cell wall biosynthesis